MRIVVVEDEERSRNGLINIIKSVNDDFKVVGKAENGFTMYEDEGDNYNYENGYFSVITFNWNDTVKQLVIGKRIGSFSGMLESRIFNIVLVSKDHGSGIEGPKVIDFSVKYEGERISVQL